MKMNIQEILEEDFKDVLDENRKIRLKTARIQKESWKLVRQIEPNIKELGEKIERLKMGVEK